MGTISNFGSISHRIKVEKIHANGNVELVGDTNWISESNANKIRLLLDLLDIDIDNINWYRDFKNRIDKGGIK